MKFVDRGSVLENMFNVFENIVTYECLRITGKIQTTIPRAESKGESEDELNENESIHRARYHFWKSL